MRLIRVAHGHQVSGNARYLCKFTPQQCMKVKDSLCLTTLCTLLLNLFSKELVLDNFMYSVNKFVLKRDCAWQLYVLYCWICFQKSCTEGQYISVAIDGKVAYCPKFSLLYILLMETELCLIELWEIHNMSLLGASNVLPPCNLSVVVSSLLGHLSIYFWLTCLCFG